MQEDITGNKAQDNHTDQTKRMFSLVSLYIWECTSTVLNGVYNEQVKAEYRAQQSQVKTLNRLNVKWKIQEERTGNKEKSNHIDPFLGKYLYMVMNLNCFERCLDQTR